ISTTRSPAGLAALLQSPQAPHCDREAPAHQPDLKQPAWALQLVDPWRPQIDRRQLRRIPAGPREHLDHVLLAGLPEGEPVESERRAQTLVAVDVTAQRVGREYAVNARRS